MVQFMIILLGPPGAGKGTQAVTISKTLNMPHVSTGDILRAEVNAGTNLGKLANTYMEQGALVPDEIIVNMVVERVDATAGALFDGFPRTLAQAQALDRALENKGCAIDAVISIALPQEELVGRLSSRVTCKNCSRSYNLIFAQTQQPGVCDHCGGELVTRADDAPQAVTTRLEVYAQQTKPLLNYYQNKNLLYEVNGSGSIADVGKRILDHLVQTAVTTNERL